MMGSINPWFWSGVSLESVQRECKRNGDSYKAGYQDGIQGYWITVSKVKDPNADGKLTKPTLRHDHRIRSNSPLPPIEIPTPRQVRDQVPGETTSVKQKTESSNITRRASSRRLSAVLLAQLESSSADDSTSIWEGTTAGARFEYIEGDILGKGSFGEVRKVSVKGHIGSVARKSMFLQSRNKRRAQDEKNRIKREVENLQRARHKHVVNILDCYSEREKNLTTYFLIMSPVGNQDLETLLDKFPGMSPSDQNQYRSRVSQWFSCLASALAYMHKEGVRHEDIKPSNIIHRGDTVYFTDFSSSRVFKPDFETSTTSTVQATRRFAAPEVLDIYDEEIHIRTGNAEKITKDGRTTYEVRHGNTSDVFSLALVFAEMTSVFNKSVAAMHAFVLVLENTKRQPLYHEVIDRLKKWFTEELKSERGRKLWQCCLQAMLKTKRRSRPQALDVVHALQREKPVGKFKDDGCQALLPPAPKLKTESSRPKKREDTAMRTTDTAATRKRSDQAGVKIEGAHETEPRKAKTGKSEKKASGVDAPRKTQVEKGSTTKKRDGEDVKVSKSLDQQRKVVQATPG